MIFKGRVALATLAMLVLTGYTDFTDEDITPSTEELYDSISMGFTQPQLELEYGEGLFDVRDFVSYADGELEVTTETVDISQVGTNVILYGVTKTDEYGQTATRYFPQGIRVVDTNYPVIELEKELITVTLGGKADLAANILSVTDVVDGDLQPADQLQPGCYTVSHSISYKKAGTYPVTVEAMDSNGNVTTVQFNVQVKKRSYLIPGIDYVWKGQKLTKRRGTIYGPSGKETYYNLNMAGVVKIMRRRGNTDEYWVRSDGVKMLGNYIMVAANLKTYPRGSIIKTSLGMAIVCDTGAFARKNPYQIDIAVNW